MGLNLLEYDALRRIRNATENLAANSTNTVSLDNYMQLDSVCRDLAALVRKMEKERNYWKAEYDDMGANRDQFAAWGDGLARQLEETRRQAEKAEAEVAALKAALAQSGQG